MKQLVDFLPLVIFFGFYQYTGNIITATMALMVGTLAQILFVWLRWKKVEKTHWITLILVLAFGGLTVALRDDTFIKWKPTILNWLFAVALLVSQALFNKNLIQKMLEKNLRLPDLIWKQLNLAWALFFTVSGALNLYVAFSFSQAAWVNFKVFGLVGLTLLFVVIQMLFLSRYVKEEEDSEKNP